MIAFHLAGDYGVEPADALAESRVAVRAVGGGRPQWVLPCVDGNEHIINVQQRVEESDTLLAEADIVLLTDKDTSGSMSGTISKERVPLVSSGLLDKLGLNILLVLYVA